MLVCARVCAYEQDIPHDIVMNIYIIGYMISINDASARQGEGCRLRPVH